jgi:hypothetical protein
MVRYKVCSYCNAEYTGASKVSRRDNKTEICSVCAEFEAVYSFLTQHIQEPTEALLQALFLLAARSDVSVVRYPHT